MDAPQGNGPGSTRWYLVGSNHDWVVRPKSSQVGMVGAWWKVMYTTEGSSACTPTHYGHNAYMERRPDQSDDAACFFTTNRHVEQGPRQWYHEVPSGPHAVRLSYQALSGGTGT